jgi:hypothetical protein
MDKKLFSDLTRSMEEFNEPVSYRARLCPHGIDLDKLCEQCSADRVYREDPID